MKIIIMGLNREVIDLTSEKLDGVIKNANIFNMCLKHLTQDQRTEIYNKVDVVKLIKNTEDLFQVLEYLTRDQQIEVYNRRKTW